MKNRTKLLIVDDSKVMRDSISDMFSNDVNIDVVGMATNGLEAIEEIAIRKPDVVTMDVSMPQMDGITALKHIMIKNPLPTLMLSSLTLEGARVAFDALRFGAVDFISKPSSMQDADLGSQEAEIRSKIEFAAKVEVEAIKYIREKPAQNKKIPGENSAQPQKVITMGGAEGGYGSLLKIIPELSVSLPYSYLVTLYASREHVDAFASYLNQFSSVYVKKAAHDECLKPGVCYINSGLDYMSVHKQGGKFRLHVSPAPFASRKGAIDMLFFSIAEIMEEKTISVILSGMGHDGVEGLEEVSHRGGQSIVQDAKTCICKQMAQSAIENNETALVIADNQIASFINESVQFLERTG